MSRSYLYGPARDVADMLFTDQNVTHDVCHNALINAMTRIAKLEEAVNELTKFKAETIEKLKGPTHE